MVGHTERTQSRHDDEQTRGSLDSTTREGWGGGDHGGDMVAAMAGTLGRRAGRAIGEFRDDATRQAPARRCEADRASPTNARSADHFASSARTWSTSARQSASSS